MAGRYTQDIRIHSRKRFKAGLAAKASPVFYLSMRPYGWEKVFNFRECRCCDGFMRGLTKKAWTKRARRFARRQAKAFIRFEDGTSGGVP